MSSVIDGVDYGPLAVLIGEWKGERGLDVAPDKTDGIERTPFYETISIEAIGDAENANEQVLAVLRYHQKVFRQSNDEQFHDQVGYWTWDKATGRVTHSVNIPRAVALVAGGLATVEGDKTSFELSSSLDKPDFTVSQSDFMYEKAKTKAFTLSLEVVGDAMTYRESTLLDIYSGEFDHVDKSTLQRIS